MDTFMRSTLSKLVVMAAVVLLLVSTGFAAKAENSHEKFKPVRIAPPKLNFCVKTCGNSFSIATAREIMIKTTWASLPGDTHEQKIVLLMPNGDLFQTFNNSLTPSKKQTNVNNILPIRGGWIQQRGITGRWTVEVYMDGKLMQTRALNITP